ncbi:MAG TPA: hypothetical protein VLL52_00150, partial [Anaerolineae bacterium]|nr:hypothetical protein [Anaerolineae bacterium]
PNPYPNHPYCAFSLFQSEDFDQPTLPAVVDLYAHKKIDLPDLPFWHALQKYINDPHPQEKYFTDERGYGFALIWLTNTEFHSLLCPLPSLEARLDDTPTPHALDAYQHDAHPEPLKLIPHDQSLPATTAGFQGSIFHLPQNFGGAHLTNSPFTIDLRQLQ